MEFEEFSRRCGLHTFSVEEMVCTIRDEVNLSHRCRETFSQAFGNRGRNHNDVVTEENGAEFAHPQSRSSDHIPFCPLVVLCVMRGDHFHAECFCEGRGQCRSDAMQM